MYWPLHFSSLGLTGFWEGCQRAQVAVHHLEMLRSLTSISQIMQSSLRRRWISWWAPFRHWLRSRSRWDYESSESKQRSRRSMTSWVLLSCLFLYCMWWGYWCPGEIHLPWQWYSCLRVLWDRGRWTTEVDGRLWDRGRDWVGPGKSWIHWIMEYGAVGSYAGGRNSGFSSPWCFQSCSMNETDSNQGSETET